MLVRASSAKASRSPRCARSTSARWSTRPPRRSTAACAAVRAIGRLGGRFVPSSGGDRRGCRPRGIGCSLPAILTLDTPTERRRAPRRATAPSELDRSPQPAGARPVLVLNNVTKTYPNGRSALQDVDLVIPEGDFVFLVGPSGAGKSTLMKLLIRDELASEGTVLLDGEDLAKLPRRRVPKVRRKVGIVFQDYKLLPTKTVRENIAFALEVTGTPRGRIGPAVERAMAHVGLTGAADQYPHQLSGGEQQRTAI